MSNWLNLFSMRLCDIVFSFLGLVILLPALILFYLSGLFFLGSPLFYQNRVGKNQRVFVLVKFRTMPKDTASMPTHFISNDSITPYGRFLRKTKLDELPQLWNVLKGDMSLVGPRPNLCSQVELISARERRGVFEVRPGITGLAQINAIDMSNPKLLASVDRKMVGTLSLFSYFKYIFATVLGRGHGDRVIKVDGA